MANDLRDLQELETNPSSSRERLEDESRALISQLDARISQPIFNWQFFQSPEVFRQISHHVAESDFALARRFEHLSNEEGCGAAIISALGEIEHFRDRRGQIARHASDEVKHQQAYAQMAVQLSSTGGLSDPELKSTDVANDLGLDVDSEREELLLSIHIGELRNLINMDLVIPSLLASADSGRQRFGRQMLDIRQDEIAHVKYLSVLITDWLECGVLQEKTIASLVGGYNQYWWDDIHRAAKHLRDGISRDLQAPESERVRGGTDIAAFNG